MAMSHADYVITEAGFGADLGAEKFFNIKCRKSGLSPKLTVIVATAQGLKMHGDVAIEDIKKENIEGLRKGLENLAKHIENMKSFGQSVVVAFNKYATDTDEEIALLKDYCEKAGVRFALNNAFLEGGVGAVELANIVVDEIAKNPSPKLKFTYDDNDSVEDKITKVAKTIYGASSIELSAKAKNVLRQIKDTEADGYPICIAKTQYSFSDNPKAYGVAKDFSFAINDIIVNNGAEFVVVVAGPIMRMPGLPKDPQANHIDIVNGQIEGLS